MSETPAVIAAKDILRVSDDLIPEIDPVLNELLERGKHNKTMILSGTETPDGRHRPRHAVTKVKIAFKDEHNLRQCVRLLRWSDDRLRARPDQLILWNWCITYREGMAIFFGVDWYDKDFFEARQNSYRNKTHDEFYAAFGATADDFEMEHVILNETHRSQDAV